MKLGLGTVQFGLDYGVSNVSGKTGVGEVSSILDYAVQHGIRILDTAPGYGSSELVLGAADVDLSEFRIVTKTPALQGGQVDDAALMHLREVFTGSLATMGIPHVYGLLVHHAGDLLKSGGQRLFSAMLDLRERGMVSRLGVSVYDGEQIDAILDVFPIDIIQLPINVIDRRLIKGGQLSRLKDRGVEVHARSVFLQGLLLMNPDAMPEYFFAYRDFFDRYQRAVAEHGYTPLEAALGYVQGVEQIDTVLVGVNNLSQLREILEVAGKPFDGNWMEEYSVTETALLNPSMWCRV